MHLALGHLPLSLGSGRKAAEARSSDTGATQSGKFTSQPCKQMLMLEDKQISPSNEIVNPMGDAMGSASLLETPSHSEFFVTPLDEQLLLTSQGTAAAASPMTLEEMHEVASVGWCVGTADCNNCHRQGPRMQLTGKNNNSHDKYAAPTVPESPCEIGDPAHVDKRVACRMALRPNKNQFVILNFRVMRRDAEMHVGQILNATGVKRTQLYTPRILDRWTRKLQIKLKSSVKVSVVFKSISARLGLQSTVGLKFCLDGFYGVEAYGDAFGNWGTGICPWMEVTGDGTPISLKLEDNDNIFINVVTEKMAELARRRSQQISEQAHKQLQQRGQRQSVLSVRTVNSEELQSQSTHGKDIVELEL